MEGTGLNGYEPLTNADLAEAAGRAPNDLAHLPVDHARIERAVREILLAVGEDPEREGLLETPARVARMYAEIFSGLHTDPSVYLQKTFTQKHDEMVIVKDIAFSSCCEHHLLPFIGKAHVGYLPDRRVVGISKLARVVNGFARRLQIQEKLTSEIAEAIHDILEPRGVGVVIVSEHSCMTMRGVNTPGSRLTTSHLTGVLRDDPRTRQEFLEFVRNG